MEENKEKMDFSPKEEKITIKVVDQIMGSGKTEAAITYMNSAPNYQRFIYVTPYLNEIKRIKDSCAKKNMIEPLTLGKTKLSNIKELIKDSRNIATTHALFLSFDQEVLELIEQQHYTLILDEVANVIENYKIMHHDLDTLLERYTDIDSNGFLNWKEEQKDYQGEKFAQEQKLCEMRSLMLFGKKSLMWLLPVKQFTVFKEVIVLTYLFDGQIQKYYYDLFNIEYRYIYVKKIPFGTYHFTSEKPKSIYNQKLKELITVIDNDKINNIGDYEYTLSKGWYQKAKKDITTLHNHLSNLFRNRQVKYNEEKKKYEKPKTSDTLWTTFKDYQSDLKGKGYAKGFLALNARATNEFQNRSVIAYTVNRYCNPFIKRFFNSYGVEIDEDMYALSEMLQFIWRSRIRQGRPITVYIPSLRMRELLKEWIREQDGEQMQRSRSMKKR